MNSHAFETSWGAISSDAAARFRLWAPKLSTLELVDAKTGRSQPMREAGGGWYELETDLIGANAGYSFRLPEGRLLPDPAARAQMGDVHGPSRLINPRDYDWKAQEWRGRSWEEAIIYELHTGTFTPDGTFDGIRQRLDHLQQLGVTAIELMPVAQFSGDRGWGYDGVLHYAPHQIYGAPNALKRLIDEAHARGLMMILDVVYNHFGPEGNYLGLYAPDFFHAERQTPWGSAIAYDLPAVRDFFIENALYWLEEYQFDGLRFDAIDQIEDQSSTAILDQLAMTVRERITDRHIHLTTEDDRNIVRLHQRDAEGRPRLFTAEWNDDFHHVAHTIATAEGDGYYEDYTPDAAGHFLCALTHGYVYQGQPSPFRDGASRGEPSDGLPPVAFIDFLQNHDQIGNRAFGERLVTLTGEKMVDLLTAVLLLSPGIPLLFMGEEWGEVRPFLYFTDFDGELGSAVREGRRNEFRKWRAFADPHMREKIPDPNAEATAEACVLDWHGATRAGARRLELVKTLLGIREREIVPRLAGVLRSQGEGEVLDQRAIAARWLLADQSRLCLHANFGGALAKTLRTIKTDRAEVLYASDDAAIAAISSGNVPAMSVAVTLEGPGDE